MRPVDSLTLLLFCRVSHLFGRKDSSQLTVNGWMVGLREEEKLRGMTGVSYNLVSFNPRV